MNYLNFPEPAEIDFGRLHFNIEELLKERNISKNRMCKHLDITRTNLNNYCQDKNMRLDVNFISKLCFYLDCTVGDLMTYQRPEEDEESGEQTR